MSRLGNRFVVALMLGAMLVVSGCKTTAKPTGSGTTPASGAASAVVSTASLQPVGASTTEAPATVAASSPVDSATPAPASPTTNTTTSHAASPSSSASTTPSGTDAAGRTPCPLPPPQVFVHVSRVTVTITGGIVQLTYRTAARLCGGEDDGAYETTGTVDKTARVDPAAKILMVPADVATSSAHQITTAELPATMATPIFEYFGVTFDPTGTVVAMEQQFHP